MCFGMENHFELRFFALQPNKQNEQTASLIRSDQIELEPNASKFAIFSAVRSSVLESETKLSQLYGATQDVTVKASTCCCHCATTCKTGVSVECRCHHGQAKSQDNNDSENDSFTDDTTEKEIVLQVPQVRLDGDFLDGFSLNLNFSKKDCRRWFAWTIRTHCRGQER